MSRAANESGVGRPQYVASSPASSRRKARSRRASCQAAVSSSRGAISVSGTKRPAVRPEVSPAVR